MVLGVLSELQHANTVQLFNELSVMLLVVRQNRVPVRAGGIISALLPKHELSTQQISTGILRQKVTSLRKVLQAARERNALEFVGSQSHRDFGLVILRLPFEQLS